MTNAEWAAWVQAVGSVIAIGVAVAVPFMVARKDRLRLEAEGRIRAKSYALALLPAAEAVGSAIRHVEYRLSKEGSELEFQDLSEYLKPVNQALTDRYLEIHQMGEVAHLLLDGVAASERLRVLLDDHYFYLAHAGAIYDYENEIEVELVEPSPVDVILKTSLHKIEAALSAMRAMFE